MADKPALIDKLKSEHTKEAIRERLEKGPLHSYLRDFIYGAIDGTVTTFAIVAGIIGADLAPYIVIILGMCNIIGDGFSLGVGNFLSVRAEHALHRRRRKEEESHITLVPEGEREEVRQIFASKGFHGEDLDRIVDLITSDFELWINTMLQEELGVPIKHPSPIRCAITTFLAFVVFGFVPIVPYIIEIVFSNSIENSFAWSIYCSGAAFIVIGAFKGKVTGRKWYIAALETLALGGGASFLAYMIGMSLKSLAS